MEPPIHSPQYARPLNYAFGAQFFAVLGTGCIMSPEPLVLTLCISAGFWVGVIIIRTRRSLTPTKTDLAYITAGYIPLAILGPLCALPILILRGALPRLNFSSISSLLPW